VITILFPSFLTLVIFCLFIHFSFNELSVTSTFWLLWITLLWTWVNKYLFETLTSILLGLYPEIKLLDHLVIQFLIFWGTTKPFSKVTALFYILYSQQQYSSVWIFFVVAVGEGFELGASHLLGRHSTTWAIPSAKGPSIFTSSLKLTVFFLVWGLTPRPHVVFTVAILMGQRWYLMVVLICISLMICGSKHLFACLRM
jgi:hypothetical protein